MDTKDVLDLLSAGYTIARIVGPWLWHSLPALLTGSV